MNSRGSLLIIIAFSFAGASVCFAHGGSAATPAPQTKAREASSAHAEPNAAQAASEQKNESADKENKSEAATVPQQAPEHPPYSPSDKVLVGSPEAGKDKTQTCVACHGTDGNSTVPNWPKIAGQHELYLVKELKDFRAGEKGPRYEASMYGMVANLTDQDIADLASFYASQKQTMGKAQNAYVALGQRIYRGGNVQTGVTACLARHGPEGQGNDAANFPKLAGQHAVYIENQLIAFRDGKRKNSPIEMMESISHRMSNDEIKAVSSYIEGLR
ncbi:MAG: cytochrome c [Candidatus Berkiella sp.]